MHGYSLEGYLISAKTYQTDNWVCLTQASNVYISILDLFMKYDDTRIELSMDCLLNRVRHSTSCTYT